MQNVCVEKSHPYFINLALEIVCVQSAHSLYYTGVYAIFLVRCVTVNRKVKWNNLKPSRSGSKTVHTFQGARVPCVNIAGMYTECRNIRNSILLQDRDDIIGNCTGPEEEKANIDSSNVPSVSVRVGARGGCVDTRSRSTMVAMNGYFKWSVKFINWLLIFVGEHVYIGDACNNYVSTIGMYSGCWNDIGHQTFSLKE
ncbi:hypothetical protein QTP88_026665 [Uroleucon formosanum]